MANNANLKPWRPGKSGNPSGRPQGSKNLSTLVRRILEDPEAVITLKQNGRSVTKKYPALVLIEVLLAKAATGDIQAFRELRLTAYGNQVDFHISKKQEAEEWFKSLDEQAEELADYAAAQLQLKNEGVDDLAANRSGS
jgi:hypothetical protein